MAWITFVWFGLLVLVTESDAAFRFANYYSNGMVLQMAPKQAQIWGYASSQTVGGTVDIYINGTIKARATVKSHNSGGTWSTLLPTMAVGGPYTIEARSSEGHVVLNDVWFGDVWVCSGQSNMGFTFNHVYNYTDVLHRAIQFTNIRFLKLKQIASNVSLEEPVLAYRWQTSGNNVGTRLMSAVCLLYAMELSPHLNGRPIGLINTAWGGTPIEAWSSPDAMGSCDIHHLKGSGAQNQPGTLWNGMVAPIIPMTIYGAIWYQGESNAGHAPDYNCSFPAMIADWRDKFHQASQQQTDSVFPFGFVQLAPSRNVTNHGGFSDLRWSQTWGYGYVPNPAMQKVFMAVAMDLPDFHSPYGSIHPRDKQDVAIRLALSGRAVAYGESNLEFQGPFPSKYTLNGHSLVIEYDNGNSIIEVRNTRGFEVCCVHASNGTSSCAHWVETSITSHDQSSVTIDTSACHGYNHVTAGVRYAWELSPCNFKQCAVYDRDTDLPAPSFKQQAPFM